MISIYTDGSYRSSEKLGGYGIAIFDDNDKLLEVEYNSRVPSTTNNRMELTAILIAAELAEKYNDEVLIYSDSIYCINSITTWVHTWRMNGWKTSKNEDVLNKDLIQQLYLKFYGNSFCMRYELKHTYGHAGTRGNEIVDALATGSLKKLKKLLSPQDYDLFIKEAND